MARIKARRPTISSVEQLIEVGDLSSGIELRLDPTLLDPEQSRLLRNWSLREPGTLLAIPGWITHSTSSLGARRIQGGRRVYIADLDPFTVAGDNGSVYKPSDGGVWGSTVLTGMDATEPMYFQHDRDLVAVFDGVSAPKKSTDGTTWTQLGITAPSVAPTASAVAGGSLIVAHTYEVSYGYQDDELLATSNEGATVQQATAGANLTIRVNVTASTDPQVDKIVVYVRNVTAGETVRRKYAEYANTTTSRDITSATWTTNVVAPTDRSVPVAGLRGGIVWKNRWWAWTGNRLYFTQIFENQSYASLFYIDLQFERGDEISTAVAQGDTLVVFGQSAQAFLVIGQTSLDFEVRPALGSQAGALGLFSACLLENGILHAASQGVYLFDGATDRLLSYNIDPGWRDLVTRASASDLSRVSVVYHALTKEARIAVPRLYPWGTAGEWILDLNRTRTQERPAWTSSDRPVGGYIHWDGTEPISGNYGRLFSWNYDAVAKIYEENVGTSADGADLVCDYEGSTHATGGYVASFIQAFVEFQPAAGLFSVEPIVDRLRKGSQTVDIGSTLSRYGTAVYGTSIYGGAGRLQRPLDLPVSAEGLTLAISARYTGQAAFRWFTYKVVLRPEMALSGI